MRARCPHCGAMNAPVDDGRITRHYRADHTGADPSNELCAGGFGTWLPVGEICWPRCGSEHCLAREDA